MTLLIRGRGDLNLAIAAVEAVCRYLDKHQDLSLARFSAFESLIYQTYSETTLVDGLLHQLATDALQPQALYEWWGNKPGVPEYYGLLVRLRAGLEGARAAYELAEKRFSRPDAERLNALREVMLAQTDDTADRLAQARDAVEKAALKSGRATLLEAVMAATGTALVPEAVVDAARAALVADLKGQHGLRVHHLRVLSDSWKSFELQSGAR